MIKKLRIKFIILSMIALFVLLAFVIGAMNIMNYRLLVSEADDTLNLIAENGGIFPDFISDKRTDHPPFFTPETPYETRYFSVVYDSDGNLLFTDTRRISAVDSDRAAQLAMQVLRSGKKTGFLDQYRYLRVSGKILTRIIFLDCGRKLDSFRTFLTSSIIMSLAGYAGFFVAILFFSKRIVAPVAESYEKQKRFITDAGHEIKTPLTIISADADVIEMEYGENEWTEDIKSQTERLVRLTDNLVHLSRMEEPVQNDDAIDFPLSDIISDIASSFTAVARAYNRNFHYELQSMIEMRGSEKSIIELTEILLENAVKYTPDGGSIFLTLKKEGKSIELSVKNDTTEPIPKDKLKLIFDRFYRLDGSRNSETGGHGIGLSIAKAIAEAHNGKITANTEDCGILNITVRFNSR